MDPGPSPSTREGRWRVWEGPKGAAHTVYPEERKNFNPKHRGEPIRTGFPHSLWGECSVSLQKKVLWSVPRGSGVRTERTFPASRTRTTTRVRSPRGDCRLEPRDINYGPRRTAVGSPRVGPRGTQSPVWTLGTRVHCGGTNPRVATPSRPPPFPLGMTQHMTRRRSRNLLFVQTGLTVESTPERPVGSGPRGYLTLTRRLLPGGVGCLRPPVLPPTRVGCGRSQPRKV